MTAISINKQHHTRFYATKPADANPRTGNLTAGLTVDEKIMHPNDYEFYQIAHYGLQGCVFYSSHTCNSLGKVRGGAILHKLQILV
ncbi:MAG: hypothetical protein GY820_21550 [Gammaproteobacteria bacterium]|nr:hypothetical protein [Gammaproteobacteria bacterium]